MHNPLAGHEHGVILYDFLHCRGGAEQLTLDLLDTFPGADLWIGYRDRRWFPDACLANRRLRSLRLPARFLGGRTLLGLLGFRCATRRIRDYPWAIFSGSTALEAVHHRRRGRNLYYCHTLPRFAYDLRAYYEARLPRWARPALRAVAAMMRYRYEQALGKMDLVIANSENVRGRLQRYLGQEARVIHPPCDVHGFGWRGQADYYLSTARLEPYKRVDLLIEAFRHLPRHRLRIASGGSDERRLRRLAAGADNIRFTGWLDAGALRDQVGNCIATLYIAEDEDFGMSPVESMAAGKPVIGVAEGGLLETVIDGTTGLLIAPRPDPDKIVHAVRALSAERASTMREACERRALDFTKAAFAEQMRQAVAEVMDA